MIHTFCINAGLFICIEPLIFLTVNLEIFADKNNSIYAWLTEQKYKKKNEKHFYCKFWPKMICHENFPTQIFPDLWYSLKVKSCMGPIFLYVHWSLNYSPSKVKFHMDPFDTTYQTSLFFMYVISVACKKKQWTQYIHTDKRNVLFQFGTILKDNKIGHLKWMKKKQAQGRPTLTGGINCHCTS